MGKRVVVTGMSGVTAFGNDYSVIEKRLRSLENATCYMPDWDVFKGLHTRLAAPILDFKMPDYYTRKQTRSMGPLAKMATVASEQALKQSRLLERETLTNGDTGVAYGSSSGSTKPCLSFAKMFTEHSTKEITANTYIKLMSHTAAVNIGLFFGLKGRLIPTSSACTSGSQAIGYGLESIQAGQVKRMLVGGGEELCPTMAAVFDTLFATSTKNDTPKLTPAPYSRGRDGLVLGEGAGTLIIEDLEAALERDAPIFAEVVGFGTNCDAQHVTHPEASTMKIAMELALKNAGISAGEIGYISGHGTGTDRGDIAETQATFDLFGNKTPFSTMKSYLGHTLGACGAIESWLAIEMMNSGWFAPTLNLKQKSEDCADLDYIMGEGREINCEYVMNNNFAFGGINTSLIFKRWHGK